MTKGQGNGSIALHCTPVQYVIIFSCSSPVVEKPRLEHVSCLASWNRLLRSSHAYFGLMIDGGNDELVFFVTIYYLTELAEQTLHLA